jgi:hypothetical protein
MNKVILLDIAPFMFKAIFNYERMIKTKIESKSDMFISPPHYVFFTMILSALKKIGVDDNTLIIGALEGKSWRKNYDGNYKAQRQGDREEHKLIDWDKQFAIFNKLIETLNESTRIHMVREWNSEADDIIAVACKYYQDKEVIIVSLDADLHQLCYYPNTYFFTLSRKCKGSSGIYFPVENPLKIIADKTRLGDKSDNILVDKDNDTPQDQELRRFIIDLVNLPEFVEKPIVKLLETLPEKKDNLDKLPEFKNVREKYLKIYEKDNVITPDYCYKLLEKRKKRKESKKENK